MNRRTVTARTIVAGVAGLSSLAALARFPLPAGAQAQRDIVDTAVAAGQFGTLARALEAAGLVEALKGAGPFTVFAPTDAAFAKVPAATLNALLADPARLRAVLAYHVSAGRVAAADVTRLTAAPTVQGEQIRIAVSGGTVRLNGSATVTQADVMASNGVIHVIDTVLMPPSMLVLPQTGEVEAPSLWPAALGTGVAVAGALALRARVAARPELAPVRKTT